MPEAPSQEEVLSYFDTLSNWGRWGDDDTLGTLNLITDAKRRQAASLVREGVSISCSRLIPWGGQQLAGGNPVIDMAQSGERYALGDNRSLSPLTGFSALTVPAGFTDDGLPVGLEFLGRPFTEAMLLGFDYAYEQATNHRRPPSTAPPLGG